MAKIQRKTGSYSPNANRKIVQVNQRQGVKGIQDMQSTTRVIYDAVKLSATTVNTTINLFENCKQRAFPLTNLTENKLQVGETITMQRFSIFILEVSTGTTDAISTKPLGYFPEFHRLYASTMSFSIAQDQVIKRLPLTSMQAAFNPHSKFIGSYQFQPSYLPPAAVPLFTTLNENHDVYHFDTDMVIPPQIEFVAQIQMPPIQLPSGFDFYIQMKIEGLGSLYSPKGNY